MVDADETTRISAAAYKGWQATRLERGPLALVLVPQVGGRIMGMDWRGQSLAFANPDLLGQVDEDPPDMEVRAAKRDLGFRLWGGDKTWLDPQDRWTDGLPFLDLDSGRYDLSIDETDQSATMTSPVCRETGVQLARTVRLTEGLGTWTIEHTMRNASDKDVTWGLWDVAMMARPATVYMPVDPQSAYPNGFRTYENEGDSVAVRDRVVSRMGDHVAVSCREDIMFKFGTDSETGTILAIMETGPDTFVGYRKSVPAFRSQTYGHGCIVEVYNAPAYPYFEMEVHGPVVTLRPGEVFALLESAAIFDVSRRPRDAASVGYYLA